MSGMVTIKQSILVAPSFLARHGGATFMRLPGALL